MLPVVIAKQNQSKNQTLDSEGYDLWKNHNINKTSKLLFFIKAIKTSQYTRMKIMLFFPYSI